MDLYKEPKPENLDSGLQQLKQKLKDELGFIEIDRVLELSETKNPYFQKIILKQTTVYPGGLALEVVDNNMHTRNFGWVKKDDFEQVAQMVSLIEYFGDPLR